eukprot:7387450-Prymnesium_polylepis.1
MSMEAPLSHATLAPGCWLAFVSHRGHYTPGWTMVDGTLASRDFPRSAHLVKIVLPLVFSQPACYMDFKLTYIRGYRDADLFRALQPSPKYTATQVGLFMVYHPRCAYQNLQTEFDHTYHAMRSRGMGGSVFHDLDAQHERITRAGFPMSQTGILPDAWFILWPGHASKGPQQKVFAQRWYYEVAHFSMREQTNFNWIVSMVPELEWTFLARNYAGGALADGPRDASRLSNVSTAGTNGCYCNVRRVPCPNRRLPGVCASAEHALCPPPCVSDVEPSYMAHRIGAADTDGFQFKPPGPRCSPEKQALLSSELCCRRRLANLPVCGDE